MLKLEFQMQLDDLLGLGEAGDLLHCQAWKIKRLFERGFLKEPPRVLGRRVIPRGDLAKIRKALIRAGYLKPREPAAA